jgi:hypothetical protein
MWQRACPWCKNHGVNVTLVKRSLWQVIRCTCGWIWGQEPHLLTTEEFVSVPEKSASAAAGRSA